VISGVFAQRWRVWVPPAVAFLLAAGALVLYFGLYTNRVATLRQDLLTEKAQLERATAERRELEAARQRVSLNEAAIREFYDERLSTERRRLTRLIGEFKSLAERAGLRPDAIGYPKTEIEQYSLTKKGIVFNVQGTYDGLRRFLNFLDLSSDFVTLEQIGVSANEGAVLELSLTLSALFLSEAPEASPVPAARRAADRAVEGAS
jgi:Tfp pilus assembly protein PilO